MINLWQEGYNAAYQYIEVRNKCCDYPVNPFEVGTIEYSDWDDGYQAFIDQYYDA